jgi:hypothetical protein
MGRGLAIIVGLVVLGVVIAKLENNDVIDALRTAGSSNTTDQPAHDAADHRQDGVQSQRAPPDAFRGIRWDSALPPTQKLKETALKGCPAIIEQKNFTDTPPCSHMHIDTDDMELFTQRRNVPPIFGVAVSEQLLTWSHRRFWAGQDFIRDYSDSDLTKLHAALVDQYGNPTFSNEGLHLTKWQWPDKKLEIQLSFNPTPKPSVGSGKNLHSTITLWFDRTE